MYITITGELGSGKSTIAKILSQEYGFMIYSTGTIQREIAREKGITTLELNQLMSKDINNIYDKIIDEKTIELSQNNIGKDIVFDSRMAWHFVEKSFKVYVTVDIYVAAKRVMMADRGKEEQYVSLEEAARSLKKRKELEDSRFSEMYSADTTNFENYDLVIDSTLLTPNELAQFIIKSAKSGSDERRTLLSPQRLFPTQNIRDINPEYVMELKCIDDDTLIDVVKHDGFYFIVDGHNRVCAKIHKGEKLISVNVLDIDDRGYVEKYNKKIEEIIRMPISCYYDWQEYNKINFLAYPR